MKNVIKGIIGVILLSAVLCAFSGCSEKEIPTGFKAASDNTCDFDMFVPESWTVSLKNGTAAAYCSPSDPSSISVMPGELEYTNSTVDDWWNNYKEDLGTVFSEFTLLSEEEASLGGVSGKCYTFTAKLGENEYRYEITAVIKHSRIYMMTFTSTDQLYESHTDTLASVKEYLKIH